MAVCFALTMLYVHWSNVLHRDFDAKCARLGQAIKQESEQGTGKRDLTRLSHWFEAFSQSASKLMFCAFSMCCPFGVRLTVC